MLSWPSETPYDLRFRLFRIPVRVHIMFWVIAAIFSGIGQPRVEVQDVLVSVACWFLSILVHEMGHGLTARAFGSPADIVLFWMGGLCQSDIDPRRHPWKRLAVLIMGPGAGFLLAGLVYVLVRFVDPIYPFLTTRAALHAVDLLIFFNIFWGVFNLLPIYPLDGGQILGVVLGMIMPRQGRQWTHVVGLVVAGVLAFVAFQYTGQIFLPLFLAMLAMSNYQILQMLHQQHQYSGGYDDSDEDWYRR